MPNNNVAYLQQRIKTYDAILGYWRWAAAESEETHDELALDISDLERHREMVHQWWVSETCKNKRRRHLANTRQLAD